MHEFIRKSVAAAAIAVAAVAVAIAGDDDMQEGRGAYAITDPRLGRAGVIPGGAVAITGDAVVETGPFAVLAPKHPGALVIGDGSQLLLPGQFSDGVHYLLQIAIG